MARVKDVQLRTPTSGPDCPRTPKEALHTNPEEVVVIGTYEVKRSVREAAGRINLGRSAKWPTDTYYAAWGFNESLGKWELWIGLRSHMPEGWRKFVEGRPELRGSRRSRAADKDE